MTGARFRFPAERASRPADSSRLCGSSKCLSCREPCVELPRTIPSLLGILLTFALTRGSHFLRLGFQAQSAAGVLKVCSGGPSPPTVLPLPRVGPSEVKVSSVCQAWLNTICLLSVWSPSLGHCVRLCLTSQCSAISSLRLICLQHSASPPLVQPLSQRHARSLR